MPGKQETTQGKSGFWKVCLFPGIQGPVNYLCIRSILCYNFLYWCLIPFLDPSHSRFAFLFWKRCSENIFLNIVYFCSQILRPICGLGTFREYCDIEDNCTNFNPICDLSGYQCSDTEMLHLPSARCLEKGNYKCLGTGTTSKFIPRKYQKYEVIFIKEVRLRSL